jgi:hypothetical protein
MHDNEYVAHTLIQERLRDAEARGRLNFSLRDAHRTDAVGTGGRWWRFVLEWWRHLSGRRAPFSSQAGRSVLG